MIEINDIIFIINPKSGNKNLSEFQKKIKDFDSRLSIYISNSIEDFKQKLNEYIDKYKVFVIVGGDGTVNTAIGYLYNFPDKILAIIPTGSGNGFAKELGYRKDIESLTEDILKGETIDIDILEVNGEKCINVAGIGFDSHVAHDFHKRSNRGLRTYILSIIKSVFSYKPLYFEIISEDFNTNGKFNLITIANAAQFGNNAYIAPAAKPNDGYYDLVLIKPFPVYYYPVFVIKLMTQSIRNSKYTAYIKIEKELSIKTSFKKYHIDGEPRTCDDVLKVKMLKQKVKFIKTKHCKL